MTEMTILTLLPLQAAPSASLGLNLPMIIFLLLIGGLMVYIFGKVSTSKAISQEHFGYSKQVVFDELTEILMNGNNKMKLTNIDETNFVIQAKTGISLFSWGETVIIQVLDSTDSTCEVKIGSRANFGYTFKNKENLIDIMMQLKMRLRKKNAK